MLEILSIMEKEFDAQSAGEAKAPLFKLTGKVTEEEYVRLNHHIVFQTPKRRKYRIFLWVLYVFFALTLVACISRFVMGDFDDWPVLLVALGCIIYLLTYPRRVDRRAAKAYHDNKMINGLEFEMSLYEDHFEDVSASGSESVPYEKLYRIIDTPTNIYLMLGPNQGAILRKVDLPEGALEFLLQVKARLENSGENN